VHEFFSLFILELIRFNRENQDYVLSAPVRKPCFPRWNSRLRVLRFQRNYFCFKIRHRKKVMLMLLNEDCAELSLAD